MAGTPDKRENQRRFAELPNDQRRSLIKAVNRGQAVEARKHAPLAVGLAQRQQRFWKLSWLMGPALGVFQAVFVGLEVGLINGGIATLGLAGLSYWFWSRAHRAEVLNREIAEGRKAPNRPSASGSKDRSSRGKERPSDDKGQGSTGKAQTSGTSRWRFWDRSNSGADAGSTGDAGGADGGATHGGGHLPGATGRLREPPGGRSAEPGSSGAGAADGSSGSPGGAKASTPPVDPATIPPGQRPYQPRGKKRRKKR